MIVKESIDKDDVEPYPEQGEQRKIVRSDRWYQDTFKKFGFNVLMTCKHDRRRDGPKGYNDEMLFCLEPVLLTIGEKQIRYGIKADVVIIDGET